MTRFAFAFLMAAATMQMTSNAAMASNPCDGVDTKLTAQRKADYARLIANSLDQHVEVSTVDVLEFMQAGTWTVVYAAVPIADPGYFFFDSSSGKPVFKDVWGGFAEESEAPEIAKWARSVGASETIASCFAHTVVAD